MSNSSTIGATASARPTQAKAIGPRLRILLNVVFALLAVLVANSVYLAGITCVEYFSGEVLQDYFYQLMFLAHLVLGLLFIVPFVVFGSVHMVNTWNRKKRRAVNIGYALFSAGCAVLVTGLMLMRFDFFEVTGTLRWVSYWLHVLLPLAAVYLYWLHRLAGPRIKWRAGLVYAGAVAATVAAMIALRYQDPRNWYAVGPSEGAQYFEPSLARTTTGNFIPAETLMMDNYCLKCHQDAYQGWFHSSHHFSSFNNPVYLASVRETREVAMKRDGNVQASRWCAGCHDPVPFFSGAFSDPSYDLVHDPTSQAGITCTSCHAITHVNSTKGNADFTIEEPLHYPFARSDNTLLQFVNNQLIKAKPDFHKKSFLKPFHKTEEFCSTCHKVHLPRALTHYKDFLRGQNHYDSYLLSGVSGHGARSFYYPDVAKTNCAGCHMPLQEAKQDLAAQHFDDRGQRTVHSHFFPAANTGLAFLKQHSEGYEFDAIAAHQEFMKGITRVDIFGVKAGGRIDAPLVAPLRPEVPALQPGQKYLVESVVRTLKMGHPLTQGTVDSNELWVDVVARSGDRVIGRSGGLDERGEVDRYAHFINVFMLDRLGNRIDRRNPQDIFVPLYNHQIPPGAANVVHYLLEVPADVTAPITVEVKLQYRKFDRELMDFTTTTAKPGDHAFHGFELGKPNRNVLPITTLAADRITFPIANQNATPENGKVEIPLWQRWNDYGIGLLLEAVASDVAKGEIKQAAEAFKVVESLNRYDGPLNLARAHDAEGNLELAVEAIRRAAEHTDPPAPPWTIAWLSGRVNRQLGHYANAEANFRSVLEEKTPNMIQRKFDFSRDYEVINELGQTYFEWAKTEQLRGRSERARELWQLAANRFQDTLKLDSENVSAHYNLSLLYRALDDAAKADEHARLHARYKPDDNARDFAVGEARKKYPAANFAAEALVIYSLQRAGAPELPVAQAPAATGAASPGTSE